MMLATFLFACRALAAPDMGDLTPDLSDPKVRLETQLDVLEGLVDNGMHEQALSMIGEMHKQGAQDVRVDVIQGRAMHLAGMDGEAVALLAKVTKKAPNRADGWAELGLVYADTGKVPDAVAALRRANRIAPEDAEILNNYGFALLADNKAEQAVGCFQKALAIDPGSVSTRNNLGFALVRLDRYDEALASFRSASDEGDARYNLGVACELHADKAGAITNYQAAIGAHPGHPLAVAALSRLLNEGTP